MEIIKLPIYYTFTEFKENYDLNFKLFREKYPDGDEDDYINSYRMNYEKLMVRDEFEIPTDELSFNIIVSHRENKEDIFSGNIEKVSIFLICQILQERLDSLLEKGAKINDLKDVMEGVLDRNPFTSIFDDGYQILVETINDFLYFFNFESGVIFIDESNLQNFEFAIKRINDFFNTKEISNLSQENELIQDHKIIFNPNTQIFGLTYSEFIEKGWIEPVRFANGEINKTGTAKMFLKFFHFAANKNQPSIDYLTSAIFDNSLSADKSEHILIRPLKNYK